MLINVSDCRAISGCRTSAVILGATRSVREAHFPKWLLVHVDGGLVSSSETVLWMIQWCALEVMGASWNEELLISSLFTSREIITKMQCYKLSD
jgi:hypothetical protein